MENSMKEVELSKNTFNAFIKDSQIPVLIDFYASWCGPCIRMRPVLAKLAEEYIDEVRVGVVDIEAETELATLYEVKSIPTQIVFKDGKVFAKSVGAKNKKQLLQLINEGK